MPLQLVKTRFSWYFPVFIIVILFIGCISSWYIYQSVDASGRESLIDRAETIALALDAEELSVLKGNESDLGLEVYVKLKAKLTQIREANKDSRFVYVMGKNGSDELFFFTDSENPMSEDYSPPGQIYYEESEAFDATFRDAIPRSEGPVSDRWGTWITGVAPIITTQGEVIAVVGIDVDAGAFREQLITYTAIPLVIALALIIFAYIGMSMRRQEERFLELKSRFVAVASHEIRSPLTGLTWAVQTLHADPDLSANNKVMVSQMNESMQNLLATTNDVLDALSLDRLEQDLPFARISLAEVVYQAVANTKFLAEQKGVTVLQEDVDPLAYIWGNMGKLRQVFMNLLSNAIKYSAPRAEVTIVYMYHSGMHQLSIKDSGIGIPKDEQEKVFSGFYRASNAAKTAITGTGLGLYLVKKIIDIHHGAVSVSSEEGKGTTVTVALPEMIKSI